MQDSVLINKASVHGHVFAHPSKSYAQRALVLGILNTNGLIIENLGECSDTTAVLDCAVRLGSKIEKLNGNLKITGPEKFKHCEISCCDSGLCLRLFAPVLALSHEEFRIYGSQVLMNRGNDHIIDILEGLGAKCALRREHICVRGPLRKGSVLINNPSGSQLISGLLFALTKVSGDSRLIINNPVSSPYIRMTIQLLNTFGAGIKLESESEIFVTGGREFKSGTVKIEGDWSSSAFLLVAGAVNGQITVSGLDADSIQPDREILRYLENAGAEVGIGENSVTVSKSELRGFSADIEDHPDLFIPLVVLALSCAGETKIYNYERLRLKESNRPAAVIKELRKACGRISVREGHIRVEKSDLCYAELETYNDHRLAMGFAVAALNTSRGLKIKNPGCVNKSYPLFFEDLKNLSTED